jgi:hypothetical protein
MYFGVLRPSDAVAVPVASAPVANLAIFTTFTIKERLKLELHGDAFNLTNTPWFAYGDNSAGITTNASSGAFGQLNAFPIVNQGNDPRVIQVSGRISS